MISLVYYTFSHGGLQIGTVKSWKDKKNRDMVCKAIKLAQQLWRRQSIFSMARAASFMLMLEPHDRHVSTQVPLLPPESPQPLEPSLSCILRRCSGKNPASVLCIITLDRPDELLDCTVLYYHNSILSASCRGHPTEPTTNTAASAVVSIALADSPAPILPVRTSAWVLVARRHSSPPVWTVCACLLQQMNQFQLYGA